MKNRKIKILNLEPAGFSIEALQVLEKFAEVTSSSLTREDLLKEISNYDILITRLAYQIDLEVLSAGKSLLAVVSATTGLNHIDVTVAKKLGINIISLKGETIFLENIHATSEYTWLLILALMRNLAPASHGVIQGIWDRDQFRGNELHGKTLGLLGLGRIGRKVASYANAFGMKVIAFDPKKLEVENIEFATKDKVIENSDIVSVHVNYEIGSDFVMSENNFLKMKKGSFFINTSRGEVIDEKGLLSALESKHLAGAALDVLTAENTTKDYVNDPLILYAKRNNNLLITPHLGGATYDSMRKTEVFVAEKLLHSFTQGILKKNV